MGLQGSARFCSKFLFFSFERLVGRYRKSC